MFSYFLDPCSSTLLEGTWCGLSTEQMGSQVLPAKLLADQNDCMLHLSWCSPLSSCASMGTTEIRE